MMHDAWCNTLVDLIFVRAISIPKLNLIPYFEVAQMFFLTHETDTRNWLTKRTKQYIEAACCLKNYKDFWNWLRNRNFCSPYGNSENFENIFFEIKILISRSNLKVFSYLYYNFRNRKNLNFQKFSLDEKLRKIWSIPDIFLKSLN